MSASFAPRMSPNHIVQRLGLAPGATAHPSVLVPMTRLLSYGGDASKDYGTVGLTKQLGSTVNHAGSDVRISTGSVMGLKAAAHGSARAWWWQW